jgi:hypothetical protein
VTHESRVARCEIAGTSMAGGGGEPHWLSTALGNVLTEPGGVAWRVERQIGTNGVLELAYDHFATLPYRPTMTEFAAQGTVQEVVMIPNTNTVVDTDTYAYEIIVQDIPYLHSYSFYSFLWELTGIGELRAA